MFNDSILLNPKAAFGALGFITFGGACTTHTSENATSIILVKVV